MTTNVSFYYDTITRSTEQIPQISQMMCSRSMPLATAAAAASLVLTGHCTVDTAGAFAARANAPPRPRGAMITPSRCHVRSASTRLSSNTVAPPPTLVAKKRDENNDDEISPMSWDQAMEENDPMSALSVSDADGDDGATNSYDDTATFQIGVDAAGGTEEHAAHLPSVGGNTSRSGIGAAAVGESVPSTWKGALRRFFLGDLGPPLVALSLSGLACARLQLLTAMPYSLSEFAIFVASVLVWWVQEYLFHRHLLHSSFEWIGKSIHRSHHERDYFHVSIDTPILLLGWLLAAHLALRCAMPHHLGLSATIGYGLAGLAYEWSHYIVHVKVRTPRSGSFPSRLFARMRDNHMRHHLVDDRYWYAFGVPAMDDLFGTNPDVKDARAGTQGKRKRVEHETMISR